MTDTDQAVHICTLYVYVCTLKPGQNLNCLSQNAVDKDSMTKRHTNIYADMSASPLFAHQGRIHKQWGLISLYICNV